MFRLLLRIYSFHLAVGGCHTKLVPIAETTQEICNELCRNQSRLRRRWQYGAGSGPGHG